MPKHLDQIFQIIIAFFLKLDTLLEKHIFILMLDILKPLIGLIISLISLFSPSDRFCSVITQHCIIIEKIRHTLTLSLLPKVKLYNCYTYYIAHEKITVSSKRHRQPSLLP